MHIRAWEALNFGLETTPGTLRIKDALGRWVDAPPHVELKTTEDGVIKDVTVINPGPGYGPPNSHWGKVDEAE